MRVITWNVRGSASTFDGTALAAFVAGVGADVAFVQEIQRAQAASVGGRLGWPHAWSFKHWPVVDRPEGMAVFASRQVEVRAVLTLRARLRVWSWRRRIAQIVDANGITAVHVHLSPHVSGPRGHESQRIADHLHGVAVVAGDFNTAAAGDELGPIRAAGFAAGDGGWLDHVFVRTPARAHVVPADAPVISDHQPVVVDITGLRSPS